MGEARERTPLLNTPGAVSQHHRLAPPAIRFPSQSVRPGFAHQGSYGFPQPSSNLSNNNGESRNGQLSKGVDNRMKPRREDSKVYTSFPVPASSPWDRPTSPPEGGRRSTTLFGRLLYSKQKDSAHDSEAQYEGQPGLPKVTRACLASEIQCWGKSICSVLLVFGVLVLLIALGIYFTHKS